MMAISLLTAGKICSIYGNEPEGGKRCNLCYEFRLKETFKARELIFDFYDDIISKPLTKKRHYQRTKRKSRHSILWPRILKAAALRKLLNWLPIIYTGRIMWLPPA